MILRAMTVLAAVALTTSLAIPASATVAAQGGDGQDVTPSGTAEGALSAAAELTGQSIADASADPDTPYTPTPSTKSYGPDGTAASAESNTSVTNGQVVSELVLSADGARLVAAVKAQICPNEAGVVTATITLTTDDGRVIEALAKGTANDNAELTGQSVNIVKGKPKRAEGAALVQTGKALLRQAEAGWRSGYCVKIEVTEGGSRQVKPKEKLPISATAKPRFGGGTISGRMDAKLTKGKTSVTPSRTSASPAKFIYTGPPKIPQTGSVTLTSTSKRGIGTTALAYTTLGDLMVNSAYQEIWQFNTVKCDGPAGKWNIDGNLVEVGSGHENIEFTLDEDSLSGTWHSTGSISAAGATRPINESGKVVYKAAADGSGGTLTFSPGGGSVPVTTGGFCTHPPEG